MVYKKKPIVADGNLVSRAVEMLVIMVLVSFKHVTLLLLEIIKYTLLSIKHQIKHNIRILHGRTNATKTCFS